MHRRARHLNPGSAGAVLALDSRFISGLSDGDPVSTWTDRSGSGNNATQSGSARPTFETGEQGGNPTIRFDGADDNLIHTATNSASCTWIALIKRISEGSGYRGIASAGLSNNTGTMLLARVNVAEWGTYASANAPASTNLGTASPRLLAMADNDASGGAFYLSGVADGTYTGNGDGQASRHVGGAAGQYVNADIALVMLLPSVTASLRRRFEQSVAYSFKIPCS